MTRIETVPRFGRLVVRLRHNRGWKCNPEYPGPEFHTDYLRTEPWSLAELNKAIPRGWRISARPLTAIGRNVTLFLWAVKEAHRPRSAEIIRAHGADNCPEWERIVRAKHDAWFGTGALFGLPDLEIRCVARSAARYSLRQYSPRQVRADPHSQRSQRQRQTRQSGAITGRVSHRGTRGRAILPCAPTRPPGWQARGTALGR